MKGTAGRITATVPWRRRRERTGAGLRRAATGAVLVALASVSHPGSAAAQRVEVDWAQSPSGQVILNATLLESGKPPQVAALRIERYPGRLPSGTGLHPEGGRFYASDASAGLRRILARGADRVLAQFAKEAGADPTRRLNEPVGVHTPYPLTRAEWDSVLGYLLQNRRTIGPGVEVREVPALVRNFAGNRFERLFSSNTDSLLPRDSVLAANGRREIAVTFDSLPVSGDTSSTRHITLRNYGARIASVTLRIEPQGQSDYRWKGDSTFILSPGDTAGADVVFTPSRKGPREAWVRVVPDSRGALTARMTGFGRSRPIPELLWTVLKALGWLVLTVVALAALLRTKTGRRLRDRGRPRQPVLQEIPSQKIPALKIPPREIPPSATPPQESQPPKTPPQESSPQETPPQEIPPEEARAREATDRIGGLLPLLEEVNRDLEATRTLRADYRALVAGLTRLFPGIPEEPAEMRNERLLAHVEATIAARGRPAEVLRRAFPEVEGDLAEGILTHVRELGRREEAGTARITELENDLAERDRSLTDLTARHKNLEETLRVREASLRTQEEASRTFEEDLQTTRASLAAAQRALAEVESQLADLSTRYTEAETKRAGFARLLQLPEAASYAELQDRLTRLTPTLRPAYLLSFVQLLTDLERLFTTVCNQARDEPLRLAAQGILRGERGNGGLRALRNDLEDPDRLLGMLQLQNPSDLWDLPWRRFQEKIVAGGFIQILNNIARLGLYAGIRHPYVDVAQVLENSGVDPRLLDRAYGMVALRLESDYRMVLRTPSLFHDQFHSGTHVRADYTVIERILPFVANPIGRLGSGVIYDLESVGYSVDGVEVKLPSVMAR